MKLEPVDLSVPVPKCRRKHPRFGAAGGAARRHCPGCYRRDRYVAALRRHEIASGENRGTSFVPAEPVRRYAVETLLPAGWSRATIAATAGVGWAAVNRLVAGDRKNVMRDTAEAILSIRPGRLALSASRGRVLALGSSRIIRGLMAQGWKTEWIGSVLDVDHTRVSQLATMRRSPYIHRDLAERVRVVAEKLGSYDIAEMDTPQEGMSRVTAERAEKSGFLTLDYWEGLDINNPDTLPHGHEALNATAADACVVDDTKIADALASIDTPRDSRHAFTQFERYLVVGHGSRPGRNGQPVRSAEQLSRLLNCSQRHIVRMRGELAHINRWLDEGPAVPAAHQAVTDVLARSEWPAPFRLNAAIAVLHSVPIVNRGFVRRLAMLMAAQPAPHGRSWDDNKLGEWFGIKPSAVPAHRARAATAGRQYKVRRQPTTIAPVPQVTSRAA